MGGGGVGVRGGGGSTTPTHCARYRPPGPRETSSISIVISDGCGCLQGAMTASDLLLPDLCLAVPVYFALGRGCGVHVGVGC